MRKALLIILSALLLAAIVTLIIGAFTTGSPVIKDDLGGSSVSSTTPPQLNLSMPTSSTSSPIAIPTSSTSSASSSSSADKANGDLFLAIPAGAFQESAKEAAPTNAVWWLDSGGYLYVNSNGTASTIIGSLPANDKWRLEYAKSNPMDTDGGYHPQNIFRLVTRLRWQNYTEQTYYYIKNINLSTSTNRNESN